MLDCMSFLLGGPDGSRTHDFYNANVALSQLSYGPVYKKIIYLLPCCVKRCCYCQVKQLYEKLFNFKFRLDYVIQNCYNCHNSPETRRFSGRKKV